MLIERSINLSLIVYVDATWTKQNTNNKFEKSKEQKQKG